MKAEWAPSRRKDSVIKAYLVDDCITWLLAHLEVFSEYMNDSDRLEKRLDRARAGSTEHVRHKRFSLLITQFLTRDEWLVIKRKYYAARAKQKGLRKQVNLPASIAERLEKFRVSQGYSNYVECLDHLLELTE